MIGTSKFCYCVSSRSQRSRFFLLLGDLMFVENVIDCFSHLVMTARDFNIAFLIFYHFFVFFLYLMKKKWRSIEKDDEIGINPSLFHLIARPAQINRTFLYWSSDVIRK